MGSYISQLYDYMRYNTKFINIEYKNPINELCESENEKICSSCEKVLLKQRGIDDCDLLYCNHCNKYYTKE